MENIGARRLNTIIEKIVEQISFDASDRAGDQITITKEIVRKNVGDLSKKKDLSMYVL